VETPFFCSFEQDVVISDEWFSKVYPMIYHENVVVACGVRYASAPPLIRKMEMVGHSIHLEEVSKGLRQKTNNAMGISFDNTIYRTDFVRSIGGFPYVKSNVGQDFSMFLEICKTEKYLWEVNYNVVSLHLKPNSYINELKHQRWYARGIRETFISNGFFPPSKMSRKGYFFNLVKSPLTSFKLLRVYGDPVIFFYHPAFCLMQLLGYIEGKRFA
jgi:cellulose synthase/poly-beta-1,6-N-acetylglucosamine synthase-like glycosyltransferase